MSFDTLSQCNLCDLLVCVTSSCLVQRVRQRIIDVINFQLLDCYLLIPLENESLANQITQCNTQQTYLHLQNYTLIELKSVAYLPQNYTLKT